MATKKDRVVYKLKDGDKAATLKDGSLIKMVSDIIVEAGGEITRADLMPKLEATLKVQKPDMKSPAAVVLSFQQRHLRDEDIITMVDGEGNEVTTQKRGVRKSVEAA